MNLLRCYGSLQPIFRNYVLEANSKSNLQIILCKASLMQSLLHKNLGDVSNMKVSLYQLAHTNFKGGGEGGCIRGLHLD